MQYGRVHRFSRTEDEAAFGETGNRVFVAAFQHGACLNPHYRCDEYGAAGQRRNLSVRAPGHLGRQPVSLVDQVVLMHFGCPLSAIEHTSPVHDSSDMFCNPGRK
ncbi:hypothetical protein G6F57_020255 [Rhizopus arrhizus]|nr:hypothetical protein G6F57_020255 [Rhizopus arrhizus]